MEEQKEINNNNNNNIEVETEKIEKKEVITDDEIWIEFEKGTRAVIAKWTALKMAIEYNFVRDSKQRVEELIETILDIIGGKKPGDADDIINFLSKYIPANFKLVIEDGSIEEVSDTIWDMYCDCCSRNFDVSKKNYDSLPEKEQKEIYRIAHKIPEPVVIVTSAPRVHAPVVDEDGWTVVGGRRK